MLKLPSSLATWKAHFGVESTYEIFFNPLLSSEGMMGGKRNTK